MSKWYTVVFVYVALVGCNQAAQETSDGASADTGGALDVRMMDGAANDGSVSEAGAVDVPQRADAQPGRADAPPDGAYVDSSSADVVWNVTDAPAPTGDSGVWENVTPAGIDLNQASFGGDNFGVQDIVVDPARSSDFYAFTCHQGVWKSTDYGQTWTGPINTGANGSQLNGKQWCAAIANASASTPPTLWTCNGNGTTGVWTSTDGGVSWTNYQTLPSELGQDIYSLVVDPRDSMHLLTGFHEAQGIAETTDGGMTWRNVTGNLTPGISYYPFFIDTGDATSSRQTWLAIPESTGGMVGTSRTTDGGTTWVRVETLEHPHGGSQVYQSSDALFMTGSYGTAGGGVYRSTALGAASSWSLVDTRGGTVAWGTPNDVYALFGWPNPGGGVDPSFTTAPQPATTGWTHVATPGGMINGAKRVAVTFDGTNYVFVGGMWQAGIWRYIEPN